MSTLEISSKIGEFSKSCAARNKSAMLNWIAYEFMKNCWRFLAPSALDMLQKIDQDGVFEIPRHIFIAAPYWGRKIEISTFSSAYAARSPAHKTAKVHPYG